MQVFAGHKGSVNCGQFTPDGRAPSFDKKPPDLTFPKEIE
jgi:hypothetical protein